MTRVRAVAMRRTLPRRGEEPPLGHVPPIAGVSRVPASRGRVSRVEEGLAIGCLLAVLWADLALIRVGLDVLDEGYFVEQASRVLRGDLPYRDFDSLYTPGLLYLHAFLFGVLGDVHVIIPRGVGLLMRALLAGGLYVLCRPLARPMFAVLPGLYVLVGLDRVPSTWEPHPGWPSAALTALATCAFMYLPGQSGRRQACMLVAIGALTGLVFTFKQNAGAFLLLALGAFSAWQGVAPTGRMVTRPLHRLGLLLVPLTVLAVAGLVRPIGDPLAAGYFLLPVAAAALAAAAPVAVARHGRRLTTWLRDLALVGFGSALVSLPWLVALVTALDGRLELLGGFVGAVDHVLLWHPIEVPPGGAWASLLGMAVAAVLATGLRHQVVPWCAALAGVMVFAVSALLLTAGPGEDLVLAALLAPGRSAVGLPSLLPLLSILAAALVALRAAPTLATWRLRWLTVAGAVTFLTQYPRMDDVHLAWSAGVPLATGAVVLDRLYDMLSEKWWLGRAGRGLLYAVLVAVPLASTLPGVAKRAEDFVVLSEKGRFAPSLLATTVESSLAPTSGLILTEEQADMFAAAARFVKANSSPDELIFVYPSSPLFYVAAERQNPTRFAHLYPGAASEDQLQDLIEMLRRAPVRVVVVSGADMAFWGPPGSNQPLEEYIVQSYQEVTRFGSYRVLMRGRP
jgi:hypothetical protein